MILTLTSKLPQNKRSKSVRENSRKNTVLKLFLLVILEDLRYQKWA